MSSQREVRCRCGRWMWAQPGVGAVQCSACHTVTQLHSLVDVLRGAHRIINGLQQLRRQQQPPQMMVAQRSPPQMMVQLPPPRMMMAQLSPPPPPRLLEALPSPFGKKRAVLCEDEACPNKIPTKRNMRKAMRWLVEGNRARDSLFFHYSGHGAQQKDYDGDEVDGQDEALIPLDHETEGKIIDDEINEILVRPLVHGAKLHAVIDACNSGTVFDLPFVCRMERNGSYDWEHQGFGRIYKGTDGGGAFCFSACDDDEASGYTPVFTGKNAGAMTYSFINAVKTAGPAPTYGQLFNLMCSSIREAQSRLTYTDSDEPSEPLLTSSEKFNIYATKFVL
ncbi:hypothetical protein Bca101_063543 [Brassica carinata]